MRRRALLPVGRELGVPPRRSGWFRREQHRGPAGARSVRTDVQAHDLSVPGWQMIQNRVDVGADAPVVRHKHPGEEVICVLKGTLEYHLDGQEPITVSAGEGSWCRRRPCTRSGTPATAMALSWRPMWS